MNPGFQSNEEAIILAAGMGTRMKSSIPKVLSKVCGIDLLHLLDKKINNIDKKVLVISQELDENFSSCINLSGKTVKKVVQKEKKGTGHAVKLAADFLDESTEIVIILYADTPLISKKTIEVATKIIKEDKKDIIVGGFLYNGKNNYGKIVIDNSSKEIINDTEYFAISKIEENSDISNICNSGFMVVRKSVIKECISKIKEDKVKKEYFLTDLIEIGISTGFNAGCIIIENKEAIGVNSQSDLARVAQCYQEEIRQSHLDNGVQMHYPNTVYFSHDTIIKEEVRIEPNVSFGNNVSVGKNVHIGSFCFLENCHIGDFCSISSNVVIKGNTSTAKIENNTNINEFSSIDSANIGQYCSIGPFARIRPKTIIKDGVKIGNFVELKESTINQKTKINHLSYIGNTNVGQEVNIGAGTITCNYDGFKKHNTTIEDKSFLGSGTIMVAPIKIGKESIIGAGTVIRENIKQSSLIMEEHKNIVLEEGATRYRKRKKDL